MAKSNAIENGNAAQPIGVFRSDDEERKQDDEKRNAETENAHDIPPHLTAMFTAAHC